MNIVMFDEYSVFFIIEIHIQNISCIYCFTLICLSNKNSQMINNERTLYLSFVFNGFSKSLTELFIINIY